MEPTVTRIASGTFRVEQDGAFELVYVAGDIERPWAFCDGRVYHGPPSAAPSSASAPRSHAQQSIAAPMPAKVLRVLATAGARVSRGETLIVLEAMKMELPLRAPADATVAAVHCHDGDMVQAGTVLADLE